MLKMLSFHCSGNNDRLSIFNRNIYNSSEKPLQKWKYNTDKEINTYLIYKTRLALKINASQIIKYYILTQLKIHINVFFRKTNRLKPLLKHPQPYERQRPLSLLEPSNHLNY